ncbi:MAG: CHASE3 domain-containing protein [Hymenobacter sp.]
METGFRGYLLLGNEQMLEPYYIGERDLLHRFQTLREQLVAEPDAAPAPRHHPALVSAVGRLHPDDGEREAGRAANATLRLEGLSGMPHAPPGRRHVRASSSWMPCGTRWAALMR